jgi:hypothetical protein
MYIKYVYHFIKMKWKGPWNIAIFNLTDFSNWTFCLNKKQKKKKSLFHELKSLILRPIFYCIFKVACVQLKSVVAYLLLRNWYSLKDAAIILISPD